MGCYVPEPLSLERAQEMMSQLSNQDIASLKKVAKPTADYEFFVEPLLSLLEISPAKKINA